MNVALQRYAVRRCAVIVVLAEAFSAVAVELDCRELLALPAQNLWTKFTRHLSNGNSLPAPNATAVSSRYKQIPVSARLYNGIRKGYRWPLELLDL
jgi:hypothetical protein